MNIKKIIIELEPQTDDPAEQNHATLLTFENGMWNQNGPVFNRITLAMAEIWKLLRGSK